MKIEIKFRGKRIDNGEWIYGSLLDINNKTYIYPATTGDLNDLDFGFAFEEVDPETVAQFIGLKDKNGKDIYNGNKVQYYGLERYTQQTFAEHPPEIDELYLKKYRDEVVFSNGMFILKSQLNDDIPYYMPISESGFTNIKDVKDFIFGEDRFLHYDDEEMEHDFNGMRIDEGILGIEVVSDIDENPELLNNLSRY